MTAMDLLDEPVVNLQSVRHSPHNPFVFASVVQDLLIHDIDLALRAARRASRPKCAARLWTPPGASHRDRGVRVAFRIRHGRQPVGVRGGASARSARSRSSPTIDSSKSTSCASRRHRLPQHQSGVRRGRRSLPCGDRGRRSLRSAPGRTARACSSACSSNS